MDPATTQAIGQIIGIPVFGALCVVLLIAYYRKDQDLQKQSKDNLALVIALQEKVILAVTKIADLMDFIEKREREREIERAQMERARNDHPYRSPGDRRG